MEWWNLTEEGESWKINFNKTDKSSKVLVAKPLWGQETLTSTSSWATVCFIWKAWGGCEGSSKICWTDRGQPAGWRKPSTSTGTWQQTSMLLGNRELWATDSCSLERRPVGRVGGAGNLDAKLNLVVGGGEQQLWRRYKLNTEHLRVRRQKPVLPSAFCNR